MSSGSFLKNGGYPGKTSREQKVWNGGDGKHEVVAGKYRDKWNFYEMTYTYESSQPGQPGFAPGAVSCTSGDFTTNFWANRDELQLQSKLVQRIKGHDFNLAVNLAQSKQLTNMCVSNIGKVARSIRALKRGDFTTALRQFGAKPRTSKLKSKDISGRWLEMQYGWLPAISDTYEAAKAYEALTTKRTSRVSARHRIANSVNCSAHPSVLCLGVNSQSRKIVYEMTEVLSNPRSLGLEDPLSVVWEVIPYSFVIDWFLPIGSYLENLAVLPFLQGRFCTTRFYKTDSSFTSSSDPFYAGARRYGKYRKVSRVITSGLNVQRPSFNPLPLALSGKRIYNAVALAHQLVR